MIDGRSGAAFGRAALTAAILLGGLVIEDGAQVYVWLGYAAFALLEIRLAGRNLVRPKLGSRSGGGAR